MSAGQELQDLLRLRILKVAALVLFLTVICGYALDFKYSVRDLDVWWHLSTGDWILQNHAVPHVGIFSRSAAQQPWMAYSWAFEVLLSLFYSWKGLVGLGLFGTLMTLSVAAAMLWGLLRVSNRFWLSLALASAACYAFLFTIMPRPVFVSMALFSLLMSCLLYVQRTGRQRLLWGMPLLFMVWANFHIQFVYGLFALAAFVVAHLLKNRLSSYAPEYWQNAGLRLDHAELIAIFICSLGATLIGPYSFHLYQVVFGYAKAKSTYGVIIELLPLNFLFPQHYVELFLGAAAFLLLGWRRKIDLFEFVMILVASVVALRTTRDAWFLCVCSVFLVADCFAETRPDHAEPRWRFPESLGAGTVTFVLLLLLARNLDFDSRGMDLAVSAEFPVDAANFIRSSNLPGPIFNSFDFGGFLIWYMPQLPVSVDGRNDLYGDDFVARKIHIEASGDAYADDKQFQEARVFLIKTQSPLATLLGIDQGFQVLHSDPVGTVFVRR